MKWFRFICSLIFLSGGTAISQSEKSSIIEQRIEFFAENLEEESPDLNQLFDNLNYYYDHPLNLNKATADELNDLLLLSEIQVQSLLQHIERNGNLISIYELQAIEHFDLPAIRNILPFITVNDQLNSMQIRFSSIFRESTHEFFYRHSRILESQSGYEKVSSDKEYYAGSPDKIYARYRFRFGKYISMGITGEKDPGEQFFRGHQRAGFDFYSTHLFVREIKGIKAGAIGDYQLSFGQGLTFATGLSLGKGMGIKRPGSVVRPYTSAGENEALRGAAAVFQLKKFSITPFYSSQKIDANNIEDSAAQSMISSLQTSGIHATTSQLEDKDATRLTIFGGHIAYRDKRTDIGITAISSSYDGTITKKSSYYNAFDFSGDRLQAVGLDFSYVWKNMHFFSETSVSSNGGLAGLAGIIIAADPKLSFSILHRNYQKEYQSISANAFSENTKPSNEKGWYIGIDALLKKGWNLNAYYDAFYNPWLKYQVSAPSFGHEFFAQVNWKLSKKTEMYWRFRQKEKMKNTEQTEGVSYPVPVRQTNFRFHLQIKAEEKFVFRTRVESVTVATEKAEVEVEKGFMIYQDFIYKPVLSRFSFTCRYALFDTDSYASRVYAFENDVLNYFSIPAYSNSGSRFYLIARFKFNKYTDLWIRYAQFLYNDLQVISSGLDEIQGNRKSEIRMQVRLRL